MLNIPCEKGGILRGLVAETHWNLNESFPYRVHIQGQKGELPTRDLATSAYSVDLGWPTQCT